jgi:glycosyltransferase involved in cell wall biosynthesis
VDFKKFMNPRLKQTIGELGLHSATFVMVMVANLIPYKGHRDLLEAVALAKSDLPDDWRLLIVGRDEGIGSQLRDLAKRLSIEKGVVFLGQRTDVAPILCCSDIGIICSHQEGFSVATIEGMAAALPMVVTDVGGLSELIVDGESGLVVPAQEPQSLAQAIRRLAKDPQLRKRLGQAGRQRARLKFTLEATVAQYEKLYSGLCEPTRQKIIEIIDGPDR